MVHAGYIGLERDRPLIRVPFPHVAVGTVLLALTGLILCLVLSLMYHYSESTYTHCLVDNYLPSISASISLVPERYIWRTCIGLHSAPRYLITASYCMLYWRRASSLTDRLLTAAVCLCSLCENTGLLLLTYVSSTETYKVHKNSFIVFIGGSLLHMLFTCRLWYSIQKYSLHTEEVTSYRWKLRVFLFNVSCCIAAGYFFRRHNKFCEPGIYTVFALLEYLVVGSNMAFHLTAALDFSNQEVLVATPPEDKRY